MNLKNLSIEELEILKMEVIKEINSRTQQKVIYTGNAKIESEYARNKNKHFAKYVNSIDLTQKFSKIFVGDYVEDCREVMVNKNSYILEVWGSNYKLYKAVDNNNKELVLEGKESELLSFASKVKEIIEK